MTFIRIDHRASLGKGDPIWLICPVRNERAILPDFIRHYRSLGIDTFCFIDNSSTDGSREYLLSQPDCMVFYTDESYREANFAADWINRLISDLQIRGWLIVADADEHLCFAGMESRNVQALLACQEAQNCDAFYAVMVDMYPAHDFTSLQIGAADRMLDLMPYFDTDYVFRRWPHRPGINNGALQILGGPRCRLLSTLAAERRHGWMFYTAVCQIDRFIEYIPQGVMPYVAALWPCEIPAQVKTPINFVRSDFRFYNSHASSNCRFAGELVSLLHFKFCSELQERIKMTTIEGNHYRRGLSYLQLQRAIRKWGSRSLLYEGSKRYQCSRDLEVSGLIGCQPAAVWKSGFDLEFHTASSARLAKMGHGFAEALERRLPT